MVPGIDWPPTVADVPRDRAAALLGGVRFRLTALATLVVAAVLTVSAVALVVLQQQQLMTSLDRALEQRADSIEADLAGSGPPTLVTTNPEDSGAQLVSASGTVLAATPNLTDAEPLIAPSENDTGQRIRTSGDIPLPEAAYRVLTRQVEVAGEPANLHVAESVDDVQDTVKWLALALLVAVPAVSGVLAALTWWLVGRTLKPVEAIRAEVADITGADLHRRVPVPPREDEIGRLARTMNEMLDRIATAAERQRRFVADASHELRTPLTRIRTEVEVDLAHPDRADAAATNETVLAEAAGLQQLIDDLLHLARSDAGVGPRGHAPLDLDDVVLAEVSRQRSETGVTIDSTQVCAAHLVGDASQLARLVRNLLANAVRHARDIVTVSLTEGGDGVELAVADDGLGVPEADRERIFERFTRVDESRGEVGGTGLGLAIVRDIAECHGGDSRYDSQGAGGARIVVRLPTGDRSRTSQPNSLDPPNC